MSDWWSRFTPTVPDWWMAYTHSLTGNWWDIDGAGMYGPDLNVGVGYMAVGDSFVIGYDPIGDAAISTTFYVG